MKLNKNDFSLQNAPVIWMAVVFSILAIMTTFLYCKFQNYHMYKEALDVSYETIDVSEERKIYIGDNTITFGKGFAISTDGLIGLPEGKQMVFIPYSIDNPIDYHSDDTPAPYLYYDGKYICATSSYDIKMYLEYFGMDEADIANTSGFLNWNVEDGYIIYMTNEGVTDVTVGLEYGEEKDDIWKVQKVYIVNMKLEIREADFSQSEEASARSDS